MSKGEADEEGPKREGQEPIVVGTPLDELKTPFLEEKQPSLLSGPTMPSPVQESKTSERDDGKRNTERRASETTSSSDERGLWFSQ